MYYDITYYMLAKGLLLRDNITTDSIGKNDHSKNSVRGHRVSPTVTQTILKLFLEFSFVAPPCYQMEHLFPPINANN